VIGEDLGEGLNPLFWRVGELSHVEELHQLFTIQQIVAVVDIQTSMND
jgi:hypothetical protein